MRKRLHVRTNAYYVLFTGQIPHWYSDREAALPTTINIERYNVIMLRVATLVASIKRSKKLNVTTVSG